MKTTTQEKVLNIIRYSVVGAGILGMIVGIIIHQIA